MVRFKLHTIKSLLSLRAMKESAHAQAHASEACMHIQNHASDRTDRNNRALAKKYEEKADRHDATDLAML